MAKTPNWAQVGPLLPIATLSADYKGPVLLASKDKTVQWFVPKNGDRGPVQHPTHEMDAEERLRYDEAGKPVITTAELTPEFWAMVEVS